MNFPFPMPPPALVDQICRGAVEILTDERLERLERFQREMLSQAERVASLAALGPSGMGSPEARDALQQFQVAQQEAAAKVGLPLVEVQQLLVLAGEYYGRRMAVQLLSRKLKSLDSESGDAAGIEARKRSISEQMAGLSRDLDGFPAKYGPRVVELLAAREPAFLEIQTELRRAYRKAAPTLQSTGGTSSGNSVDWL